MKPLITAIGITTFLFAGVQSYALPVVWDGSGGDNYWSTDSNWQGNSEPGINADILLDGANDAGDDTAVYDASASATSFRTLTLAGSFTFDVDTNTDPDLNFTSISLSGSATVTGDSPWNAGSLTIDADTPGAARSLTVTGSSLTVSTDTTIIGDVTDASTDYDASLTVSGGTFDPAAFYLYGGDPGATYHGQAYFKLDESGTLTAPDSITMQGNSKFETEQTITLSGVTLTVQPDNTDNYATEAVARVVDAAETMTVGTLTIGGANYSSKLTFTGSGKLATN